MAAITKVAAEVKADSSATIASGTAGATVTAGDGVYKDADDSDKWKLADNNVSPDEAGQDGIGMAMNSASDGQPIDVCTNGLVDMGASQTGVAAGTTLCVGSTAGQIVPDADVTSGMYKTIIGVGTSTANQVKIAPVVSGAAVP